MLKHFMPCEAALGINSCWTKPRVTEFHTLSIKGLLFRSFATLAHTVRLFNTDCCFSIAFAPPATLMMLKHSTGSGAFRAFCPAGATAVSGSSGLPVFFLPKAKPSDLLCCQPYSNRWSGSG